MKFITLLTPLVAAASFLSTPVEAGSAQDVVQLIELVEGTGTQVSVNTNQYDESCKGKHAYYVFEEDKIDLLVVCEDQTNTDSPDEVWEAMAHESMHIAQACVGWEPLMPAKYHPRLLRELRTLAPHYAKTLMDYSGNKKLLELEAFWAELQAPERVIDLFEIACYEEE